MTVPLDPLLPNDICVAIDAVSVNPIDTKQRQTQPQTRVPRILGFDAAGTVVAIGANVTNFQLGDAVFYAGTTKRPGSNQDFQIVDARLVAHQPKTLFAVQSAAIPLTALTAWELLFEKFGFVPEQNANTGQKLLIINGAGGVGSMMLQLAHWSGLTTYATASPKKADWLRQNGADQAIDYHADISQQLPDQTENHVNAVAILYNPTPYFESAAALVAPFGHVGSTVEVRDLPVGLLKAKAASMDWAYMFAKSDFGYNMASQGQILQRVADLLDAGLLKTTLQMTLEGFSVANFTKAHELVEAGHMTGKIVLKNTK